MHRRDLLRLAALSPLLAAAGGTSAAKAPGPIDLMPKFWQAYDDTRDADDRTQALAATFFSEHAEVYAGAGLKPTPERLGKWLPDFDAMAGQVRKLGADFGRHYQRHVQHFQVEFPDFRRERAPIYLMPSLFGFDGHLRPWQGKLPLFIGIDGIVRYHGADANLSVFLDHESFHLYHAQVLPDLIVDDDPPVYGSLWSEGIATYVSERLNPDASLLQVLLDDRKLAQVDAATVRDLAAGMLKVLDSVAPDDSNRYFSAGHKGPEPARGGYLLGLILARRIGRDLPLAQLPRVPTPKVRLLLQQHLAELAQGTAA
ncbi:tat (twin-arginine translocation) pathway signal sequence domain protein [Lysobacter antibioticus]|uniref:hypothetical protein n=1 Tax=Lysobacter antibioticus TaxID=84531 RepID=UPI000716FE90|nr:hypothetical protein [Lysobacter antibioticus]ALN60930.1 tat (twin-arginine translocation) pathway signal sequence domain protein [Lysobacter antibioticus]